MMNKDDDDDVSDAEVEQEDDNEMTSKVKPKYDLKNKSEKTLKKWLMFYL